MNATARRILRPVLFCIIATLAVCIARAQVTHSFTEPFEQSEVAAAEMGVVAEIKVSEGQQVRKGDVLALLDHEALSESLRIAEIKANSMSKIESATATKTLKQRRKDTIEPMFKEGHANREEFEEAQLQLQLAISELQLAREEKAQAEVDVDRIRAQIRARTITSPINGVVTEIDHRLGEYISGSEPRFATIMRLDRLKARFYLTADDAIVLKVGMPRELLVRQGVKMRRVQSTVDFVSPVIDPDSGTVRVDVVIENVNGNIRSGSPCQWISASDEISTNSTTTSAN